MNGYDFFSKKCNQEIRYGKISKKVGKKKLLIYKLLSSYSKDNLSYNNENELDGLQVFDAYITAYLKKDPSDITDRRTILFENGEFESIFDIALILPHQIEETIRPLMHKTVAITCDGSVVFAPIFESIKIDQDNRGLWKIELVCSSALEHVLGINDNGDILPIIE